MKLIKIRNYFKKILYHLKNILKFNFYKVQLENPINSSKEDVIGFDSEVKRLKSAIKQGANTVGLISDFGAGKSSLIHLLKKKLCFIRYKIVKINLWDNELSKCSGASDEASPDSIVKLHKTFLRQLSMQHRRYKMNYINKRLNLNYGIAKISFPNYRTLFFWLFTYLIVIGMSGILIAKFFLGINSIDEISYSDKLLLLNKVISLIPMIFLIFILIFIIFNKEVLFSLWNNSKDRKITEEDTIQLYNDLVTPIFPRRIRKLLIVIEDLDRINNEGLVKYYINEFYRIYVEGNNRRCKSGITFIFCLKDEFLYHNLKQNNLEKLETQNDCEEKQSLNEIHEIAKNDRKFIKLFDYICNLSSIYINDYDEVLNQLVNHDKLLKHMISTKEINLADLQWLIRGEDLNIRVIKSRLELFKSIYLRLLQKSKEVPKTDKISINPKMCAFASFVKSEYPNNLYNVLENTYSEDNQNYIDIKINEFLIEGEAKLEQEDSNNNLKKYIVELVNNKMIDEEYKKYFYNIPKGIKPLTVNQLKLSKYILENSIPDKIESLDLLINMCNTNDFIYKQLEKRVNLGRGIPSIVFLNTILFQNATHFDESLDILAQSLFVVNENNIEKICNFLNEIQKSSISKYKLSLFLKKYIKKSIDYIEDNNLNSDILLKYRGALYNCLGDNIINIKELYHNYEIEEDEISKINNPNTILELCEFLNIEKQETIMINRLNQIEKLDFEVLKDLIKKFKNINIILKLTNLDKLEIKEKMKLYTIVTKEIKDITIENKIELLTMLNYYNKDINKTIIDSLDNNKTIEKMYVDYANKINIFDDYAVKYFITIPRVYKLNSQNLERLKEYDKEKYLICKSLDIGKIDDDLIKDKKLLSSTFIKYQELTNLFNNNLDSINILINSKTYLKIKSTEINDKILVFSTGKQNASLIDFILNSESIDITVKCVYFGKIVNLDIKTAKYLYGEILLKRENIAVAIKKSIYDNRLNIFKNLPKNNRRSIARILSNDINEEGQ